MESLVPDSSPVVKKLKQACLPFKPCTAPPLVSSPPGIVGIKKRRSAPTNAHRPPKNVKVENKKSRDKSAEKELSDDKVVSSTCEVDCSTAFHCTTSPKPLSSRNSLDNFVHTTQKLEVTTSTDGDLVDLTVEDECISEAVADSPVVLLAEDAAQGYEACTAAADVQCIETCTHVALGACADTKPNSMQCVKHAEVERQVCNSSGNEVCVVSTNSDRNVSNTHESCIDAEHADNSPVAACAMDHTISVTDIDNDVQAVECPACDKTDNDKIEGEMREATIVLVKCDDERRKVTDSSKVKSKMTTSCPDVSGDAKKSGHATNVKPKKKLSLDEKHRLKEEKENLRMRAKEQREKEKQDAKLQKEQERAEKQKEKEQRKKDKEEERVQKLQLLQDEKKKKQDLGLDLSDRLVNNPVNNAMRDEYRLKAEEKRKKEELKVEEKKKKDERRSLQENKVTVKEKELMQKFFIPQKETVAVKSQDVKTGPFMDFEVKKGMRIAPRCRVPDLDVTCMTEQLDEHLARQATCIMETALNCVQEADTLYVDELKRGLLRARTFGRTWPRHEKTANSDVIMLSSTDYAGSFMRAKLLQFHENYRPAYYGTWRKRSSIISGRRPWQLDTAFFAYDVDSDDEWEEEEPGESLSHSEGEEEEENDAEQDDEGDGFFVPHGYLSEGEGCDGDDEEGKVSPEKMKDRLLAKMRNWEAEVLARKCDVLQPVVICITSWDLDAELDPLARKLQDFQVMLLEEAPFEAHRTANEQSVKKMTKETKAQSTVFVPLPETDLPELARLVHGNSRSIQKLVREFCEFWCRKNNPNVSVADGGSCENGQLRKVSKRKVEAKIREIAVYEFRPNSYSRKLWYVNQSTLDKLNLILPVPTEWTWITLTSSNKASEANSAGITKPSSNVDNVQPSPATPSSTIKSFMSAVTPNRSELQTLAACSAGDSPTGTLPMDPSQDPSKVTLAQSASPVCNTRKPVDAKVGTGNPDLPFGTPSSNVRVKKRKFKSVKCRSLPEKQQPCLLFSRRKLQQDDSAVTNANNLCVRADDKGMGSVKGVVTVEKVQELVGDDDCMIVDSPGPKSAAGVKLDTGKQCSSSGAVNNSVVQGIGDVKPPLKTNGNCNLHVQTAVSKKSAEAAVDDE